MSEEDTPRKVYWTGRQWCVTDLGLETVEEDRYYVEAGLLGELTDGTEEVLAERMRHICEKTWVDVEDFAAAFAVALAIHADKVQPLPPGAFLNALRDARMGKREDEIWNEIRRERGMTGGIDFRDGGDLMIESDRRMQEQYPDSSVFEFVADPSPRPRAREDRSE